MAGNSDRSSTGETGPMARRPAAGRPHSAAGRPEREPVSLTVAAETSLLDCGNTWTFEPEVVTAPDFAPRAIQTQAAYRQLITSGFSGQDAAGLISYVVGLPRTDGRWSLSQVNRLLFLRDLYSNTDWGVDERRPA
jgi:hypothetical protein